MSVYGMDFRRKVVAALDRGDRVSAVAKRFEIDPKTVRSYRRLAAAQRLAPRPSGPKDHVKLTPQDIQTLQREVQADPSITLAELQTKLSVHVVESTISRALRKLNLSFKKIADRLRAAASGRR